MVIAEALAERKDTLAKVAELTALAGHAATRDEDEPEDSDALWQTLAGLTASIERIGELTNAINAANNRTSLVGLDGDSITIAQAIVVRDGLKLSHKAKSELLVAVEASLGLESHRRWSPRSLRSKEDVRKIAVIDISALRDEINGIAKQIRLLDIEIQKVNWTAEL
jgi:hypothetical protein